LHDQVSSSSPSQLNLWQHWIQQRADGFHGMEAAMVVASLWSGTTVQPMVVWALLGCGDDLIRDYGTIEN
jgi:4-diphosphocytidyl-2C-methyl-D-erythritol kinase